MKKLNCKNHGSLFHGRTWQYIFDYLLKENDPDTWIEAVYGGEIDHLFGKEDKIIGYALCGAGNHRIYRNKIPHELNNYIEENLKQSIKYSSVRIY